MNLNVKVGPQFYMYEQGALEMIPTLLDEYKAERVLIIHGKKSWEKAKNYLGFLDKIKVHYYYHKYSGECSYASAEVISNIIQEMNIDFLIGIGGGKLVDVVSYSAHLNNINFGVVPTLASNCAPWAPLSVMYKENGVAEGKTEHYYRQASFFITDPKLVIDSPAEYFIAGMADTLAKWYESELVLEQDHLKDRPFLKMAKYAAEICRTTILKQGMTALESLKKQEVSPEFINVSEIIFGIAGLVGGFGGSYSRNTAAHGMHDALSKYTPEVNEFLHGEKVAYGIMYQLALEERWELIPELRFFYEELSLPKSLKDMHVDVSNEAKIDQVVDFLYKLDKVHVIPIEITKEKLKKTIYLLEDYFNKN